MKDVLKMEHRGLRKMGKSMIAPSVLRFRRLPFSSISLLAILQHRGGAWNLQRNGARAQPRAVHGGHGTYYAARTRSAAGGIEAGCGLCVQAGRCWDKRREGEVSGSSEEAYSRRRMVGTRNGQVKK